MRDRRVAPHIWQTPTGWRVKVRGVDAATGRTRPMPKRFPPTWTLPELEEFRDTFHLEAKRQRRLWREAPRTPGPEPTFTAEARRYLALDVVKAMPSYTTRMIEIEKWIAIFSDRVRATITSMDIDAELQKLKNAGYSGSTVNKFRTALMSLWTRLDGRSAANPVKDTQLFDEAELLPRGQTYELLQRILALIPDDQGVVERETIYAEVWRDPLTTIAPRYGLSASFLKRVCRALSVPTPPRGYWAQSAAVRATPPPLPPSATPAIRRVPEAAKARARLELLAWTGMDPSQLQRMGPSHVQMFERQYVTPHRRKGSRRAITPRPVIPKPMSEDAAQAFQRCLDLGLLGQPFDTRQLRRTWIRAQRALEVQLRIEFADPTFTLPHVRLKDIRHSFGTKLYADTKDLSIVGQMLDHATGSPMTVRYSLGAVPDVLRSHVGRFPRRVILPPQSTRLGPK